MSSHKDEETLRRLYHGQNLSQPEIAERLGCSQATISRWMDKHEIEAREFSANSLNPDAKWKSEDWLRQKYNKQRLSAEEMADLVGCSATNIRMWMKRYDIKIRRGAKSGRRSANWQERASYYTGNNGYEVWNATADEKNVLVHRLAAVAWSGFDAVSDNVVHHENNIPWVNTEDNLTPMDPEEHNRMHAIERLENGNCEIA